MNYKNISFRYNAMQKDIKNVYNILNSTDFFNQEEIHIACELVKESIEKGQHESWYNFIFIDYEDKTIAYTCYWKIDGTVCSYDLYWICTHNDFRWKWIGWILLKETEKNISNNWKCNIYAETASKDQYKPTREFYEKNNYIKEAIIKDFYDNWDDKIIYSKTIL